MYAGIPIELNLVKLVYRSKYQSFTLFSNLIYHIS
jgi:hypothetical protein